MARAEPGHFIFLDAPPQDVRAKRGQSPHQSHDLVPPRDSNEKCKGCISRPKHFIFLDALRLWRNIRAKREEIDSMNYHIILYLRVNIPLV